MWCDLLGVCVLRVVVLCVCGVCVALWYVWRVVCVCVCVCGVCVCAVCWCGV